MPWGFPRSDGWVSGGSEPVTFFESFLFNFVAIGFLFVEDKERILKKKGERER